jgi:hypothetical protein
MQTMPVGQVPTQLPVAMGAHADPGGKPNVAQSASRLQNAHLSRRPAVSPQKLLPAVVRVQTQLRELLQNVCIGLTASQIASAVWWQVPVPWARHRFRPGLPVQIPEQHWRWRRQGSFTSRQPNRFGVAGFGRLRFLGLGRFGFAAARVGTTATPSPAAAKPRSTSRREGRPWRDRSTPARRLWSRPTWRVRSGSSGSVGRMEGPTRFIVTRSSCMTNLLPGMR